MADNDQQVMNPDQVQMAQAGQMMHQAAAQQVGQSAQQMEQAAAEAARQPEPLPELSDEEHDIALQWAQSQVERMHGFRRQLDPRRATWFRQFIGRRDQKVFPDGVTPRSNTFVPYPHSTVRTIVTKTMDAFFTPEPWFEARGRTSQDADSDDAMQTTLGYVIKKSNFLQAFEAFLYNVCIYGHAGLKVGWDFGSEVVEYKRPDFIVGPDGQQVLNPATGQPIIKSFVSDVKEVPRMCPTFQAVDVYDLLIDPDRKIKAHMVERSWGEMKREWLNNPEMYFKSGIDELNLRLKETKKPDEVIIRMAEIWNEIDNSMVLMTYGQDNDAISYKEARTADRGYVWQSWRREVFGGQPILLYKGPNPYRHKRCALIDTSYIKMPNEPFGMGVIEIISDPAEALNRMINMISDNWNMGINHRYAYDVNADIDHQALNKLNVPLGKVAVNGDPSKVLFPLPFFTPNAQDYQLLEIYRGMIELASGVSDFYSKGLGSGGSNRSATGIQSIIGESGFIFKEFIRNIELDVLQPLLKMVASMIQQYITDDFEVSCTGQNPMIPKYPRISPEQLIGTFEFDIVAANYATNKVVRQRNMLAFSQGLMQNPVTAQLVEPYGLIKELAKVFEIKQVDKILKPPQQVQQEQQQAHEQQIQDMVLEHTLDTNSKIQVQASKPPKVESTKEAANPKHKKTGKPVGKPRKPVQMEGKIPGMTASGPMRSAGQATRLGGMGLGDLNDIG